MYDWTQLWVKIDCEASGWNDPSWSLVIPTQKHGLSELQVKQLKNLSCFYQPVFTG